MRRGGGPHVRAGGGVMGPAVCGPNGNPNCGGSRRRVRGVRRGGARGLYIGSLHKGGRGGRVAMIAMGDHPFLGVWGGVRGGSRKWVRGGEYRPAVCGESGNPNCGGSRRRRHGGNRIVVETR